MQRERILIVDDDRLLQNSLTAILGERHQPLVAGSGEDALGLLEREPVDLVLLDVRLPGMDGIATLEGIRARHPELPVIMMTAYEDTATVIAALRAGAHDYLVKPLEIEMFELAVDKGLANLRLQREVESLRRASRERWSLDNVVAESSAIREVFAFADRAARSHDTTVLIEGESGVGKEVVARLIHLRSSRADGPFVGLNCGAISRELLESELFGYDKGTFTGGLQEGKQGKFELADNGTLLLDEVSELQPAAQVKLLRFLEEREFYPVGGTRRKKVDVRIIAATNRDLDSQVRAGGFREDLYYRLNVARVRVPPLRERPADILPLARHFLLRFNDKFGRQFAPAAGDLLLHHPWRGNIRELKNAIERVVLMEDGRAVQEAHLAFLAPSTRRERGFCLPPEGIDLERLTRDLIVQALERTGGNRSRAARLLGISRPTLVYRMDKHKIRS
jgi:DNA-binding NtrC family response regulator